VFSTTREKRNRERRGDVHRERGLRPREKYRFRISGGELFHSLSRFVLFFFGLVLIDNGILNGLVMVVRDEN
jgi:hypothetical protein